MKSNENSSHHLLSSSMHEKRQLNYFIERSLFIEIKEARNLTTLMSVASSNSNNNNKIINDELSSSLTNHQHHHNSLSKQISAPLPNQKTEDFLTTSSTNIINNNLELFKNYHFYCLILLNSEILIAKTKNIQNNLKKNLIQISPDLIWNENFTYENIPLDITSFKLLIFATKTVNLTIDTIINSLHTTNSSTNANISLLNMLKFRNTNNITCVGEVSISLSHLLNKGLDEKWYKIDAYKFESDATIRLQIRFNEEKILYNIHDYNKLQTYLTGSVRELCAIYLSMGTERSELKLNLIKFYINQTKCTTTMSNGPISDSDLHLLDILKLFLSYEIDNSTDLNTLFRSTTLTTSLMDFYMRSKTKQYLQRCVYEPFIKILKQTKRQQKSFELDTSKFESQLNPQAQLELNLQHFKKSLTILVESICQQTLTCFPIELIYLFQHIRRKVSEKWSTATNLKYARVYCISSFIFLRLICPFLMNLNSATLVLNADENGDTNTNGSSTLISTNSTSFLNERYIKLIAKVLQTSANLTECKKEPFMQPLSEYLFEVRNSIVKFIDFISNYDDLVNNGVSTKQHPQADECMNNENKINLSKNLAYLHRLFKNFSIRQQELYKQQEKDGLNNNHKQLISKEVLEPLIEILNEINVKID